jgi:hypothetical protein
VWCFFRVRYASFLVMRWRGERIGPNGYIGSSSFRIDVDFELYS